MSVETRIDRIGRSSFAMSHRMTAGAEARIVGDASTVLVTYDYASARPMEVPGEWRAKLAGHEGRPLDDPQRTTEARPEPAAAT